MTRCDHRISRRTCPGRRKPLPLAGISGPDPQSAWTSGPSPRVSAGALRACDGGQRREAVEAHHIGIGLGGPPKPTLRLPTTVLAILGGDLSIEGDQPRLPPSWLLGV